MVMGTNRSESSTMVAPRNPGGATPTFGVSDIGEAKASLEARGVRMDGDVMEIENMVRLLTFFDPDDNALMFFQLIGEGSA